MTIGTHHVAAVRPNYRVLVASWLPALQLAYVMLVWPIVTYDPVFDELTMAVPRQALDTPLNKMIPPFIGVVALALLLAERPSVPRHTRNHLLLVCGFWVLAAASIAWSIEPGRVLTEIARFSFIYLSVAIGCILAGSLGRVLRPIAIVFAAVILANAAAIVVLPSTPIGHPGIYSHKNLLGLVAAMGLLVFVPMVSRRGVRSIAALAAIAAFIMLLVVSESKTSLLLALMVPPIAGAFAVASRHLRIPFPVALALTVLVGWIAFRLASAGAGMTIGDISMVVSGEPTFTGRTELWQLSAGMIEQRPLLGYGFRSFWQLGANSPTYHYPGFLGRAAHGHNGYVDIMLHLGLVGLVMLLAVILSASAGINRIIRRAPRAGFVMASLLVFLCLRELLESDIFNPLAPSSIVFALLLLLPLADRSTGQADDL